MLTAALGRLFAVAEAYPDLKANQNFMMLQEELSGTENKIAYARQFYNDAVLQFNTRHHDRSRQLLRRPDGEDQARLPRGPRGRRRQLPQVSFGAAPA